MVFTTDGFSGSSYRTLDWVAFEPMTTEFSSDALTDLAIRPWVQLALRTNFVEPIQMNGYIWYIDTYIRHMSRIKFILKFASLLRRCTYSLYFWLVNNLSCENVRIPSNKTQAPTKSTNMNLWVVGTSNQLFIRRFYTESKFF